jgi:hypothetical protein
MSVRITTWAWEQQTMSSGERLVLLALADHAGDDGLCYPGTGRLADKCGFSSATTVRNHLDTLEARGLIRKVHRRRKKGGQLSTWLYCVGPNATTVEVDEDGCTSASPLAVDQRQPTGATSASPVAVGQRQPTGALNRQYLNREDEPSDTHVPAEAGTHALADEFDGFWKAYPRRVGKPEALKAYVRARSGYTTTTRGVKVEHPPVEKRAVAQGLGQWLRAWDGVALELVPHPTTWLNQRRWEDTPPAAAQAASAHARTRNVLERLAQTAEPAAPVAALEAPR